MTKNRRLSAEALARIKSIRERSESVSEAEKVRRALRPYEELIAEEKSERPSKK